MMMKARFRMPEEQVDWRETIDCLLDRAKRPFVPIDKTFVQMPRGSARREGPLATFVKNGDLRGLKAYLLIVASASSADESGEWYTTLPLQAWARAFGCFERASGQSAKTAAGKIFARLEERGLIKRTHDGGKRDVRVRLLAQDGSGEDYRRPTTGFLRLSHEFWKIEDRRTDQSACAGDASRHPRRATALRAALRTNARMVRMVRGHRGTRIP